jgi:hypothetical protein
MNFKLGLVGALALGWQVANAQTTAFTYQGQLASGGNVATGNYDLRFRLFDVATNLVAGPVTNAPVGVTNGLFLTTVDFGATAFPGAARFLEIAVRTNGSASAYTVLAPNQPLTSVPYAIQSLNAANAAQLSQPLPATNISGTLPIGVLPANVALLTSNQTFTAANTFNGVVTATNTANAFGGTLKGAFNGAAFGTFSGTGSNLTAIPATSLTGTLPDANLSTNVPLVYNNANFLTNVTAVQFTGSGHGLTNVPGAFFWLTVNGTTAQASSNLGFIVTNNSAAVTITLPANPSAGDTFRVAGVGAAGWYLIQNAGQQILSANLAATAGLNWVAQSGSGQQTWSGLASSADGTKLVATVGGVGKTGYIYTSANSGLTWNQVASVQYWSAVASSADGTKLVATAGTPGNGGVSGQIYVSANSGSTWTQVLNSGAQWVACASSADGSHLITVSYNGYIGLSANSGASWSFTNESVTFTGAASSDNGAKLAVCGVSNGGYIYTSTNYGSSWVPQVDSGPYHWSAIASSADGTHLVATATGTGGGIFCSPNGGVTWVQQNQNAVNWTSVASSSDGSQLAAGYNGGTVSSPGYIFLSGNSGLTFAQSLAATNAPWIAIASSADGSKLAAAAYNGYIYTTGQNGTTAGTNGYLFGGAQSALELQYVGNGVFLPLSHEGTIRAF